MSGAGWVQCNLTHFFLRKIVKFDAEGLAVLEANTTTLQRSDLYYSCSAITFVCPAK